MRTKRIAAVLVSTLTALVAVSVAYGASVAGSPTEPVRVSAGAQSGLERDDETGSVFVPVTLSAPSTTPIEVSFHTADGTAVAGEHYLRRGTPANPRTVTIPSGQLQTTINVPLLPRDGDPQDREFSVVLVGVTGGDAVIGTAVGTATIVDSDLVAGANPALNVSSPTIEEGDEGRRLAQFQIHLSRAPVSPLTVTYATADGTAVAGNDYVAALPGTVVFVPGQISRTIDVLVESNTVEDGNREFFLDVTISGGSPVEELNVRGVATIRDDDAPPDTVPPVLDLPDDRSVPATSSLGAEVEWIAAATDDVDGVVPVECSPASGSLLAVGTTSVTCTASDTSGNVAQGSFTVTVGVFPTPSASALSAGAGHTCALLDDGTVRCWGANDLGQLGDGTTTDSSSAVPVAGLTGATAISAGVHHTCAVLGDGSVRCWGSNGNGRLGTGSTGGIVTEPTRVGGLDDAVGIGIGAGGAHTCAVLEGGTVRCWGANGSGQLGDGSTVGAAAPVTVSGISTAVEVTAGNTHSCARLDDATLRCWGSNGDGKLGAGSTGGASSVPVEVVGATGTTTVAAGLNHSCLTQADGSAACWGRNGSGRLGTGDEDGSAVPVEVVDLDAVVSITAGNVHSCARRSDGTVRCWGGNSRGQLGTGDTVGSTVPVAAGGLTGVSEVSAGLDHTCAIVADGTVRCWGANGSGQLGNGSTTDSPTPVVVDGIGEPLPDPTTLEPMVVTGSQHSCALDADGDVSCWGSNLLGQLGTGDTIDSTLPVALTGLDDEVEALSAGNAHTCALTADGDVFCWGDNLNGQLGTGDNDDSAVPLQVVGLPGPVSTIVAGSNHTCASLAEGGVRCWGWGTSGQLGQGVIGSSNTPLEVVGLPSGVVATSLGGGQQHTCAGLDDGSARCWGRNAAGQLGNGSTALRVPTPVQPIGLESGVSTVGARGNHSCAIQNGTIWCFGLNGAGQLGNGTTTNSSVPVQVTGLSDMIEVAPGGTSTCGRNVDGAVWCWGLNQDGQLGIDDPDVNNSPLALPVVGLGAGQTSIDAGTSHACARQSDGTVRCWGLNTEGQLGDGTTTRRFAPVLVSFP